MNENKLFGSMRTMSPKASASPEKKAQGKADSSNGNGNAADTDRDARYCPVFFWTAYGFNAILQELLKGAKHFEKNW